MEGYDLEIGPIQRTFDHLFKSISQYFQSAPVAPEGSITETNLSSYSQEQLRETLNGSLKHYGYIELPFSLRVVAREGSKISGIHRSDNITTYIEKMGDGSVRTFNFYDGSGPGDMKTSFYWLDLERNGEQTQGILTVDDRWYLRIMVNQDNIYYLRMEKEILHQG